MTNDCVTDDSRLTAGDRLFFRDIVRSYTRDRRYLRREWLADVIAQKFAQQHTRYVVVRGAPGSGKSSLVAQIAKDYPRSLLYLLRGEDKTTLARSSARSFLVRVGLQFSSLHPEAFETDAIKLEVRQSAKTASAQSELTGARIGRLLASPFYQTIVRIRQQVGALDGRLTGVEIKELVSDPHLLPVSDLEELALWAPADILLKTTPSERVVVLVDALDELAGHGTDQDVNLLKWLHDQPEIPENVRFVLTSRPSKALDAFLAKQAPFVAHIELDPGDEHVKKDVAACTRALASEMRAQGILSDAGAEVRFVAAVIAKAAGNLGYVGALGRAFDVALKKPDRQAAMQSLLKLTQLPPTLEHLHAFFFGQMQEQLHNEVFEIEAHNSAASEPQFLPSWPGVYRKVLGVLSVAYEPLTAEQIADLGQIPADPSYVVHALENLEQFLQTMEGSKMRFYHATVGEFLTASTTRANAALFVDAVKWNERIAALLDSRFARSPDALDDYAVKYRIPHHIAGAGAEPAYISMSPAWMLFKRSRTGNDQSFHTDIVLVIQALRAKTPLNIVAIVRCCLIDSMLLSRAAVLPPPVASILAIGGQRTRADSIISLISDPGKRAEAFLELAHGLQMSGDIDSARDALRSAVTAAKTNPYYGDRLTTLATVLSASFLDADVAASALAVATTVTEAADAAGDERSWDGSIAEIYERSAQFLPAAMVAELRTRLDNMLNKPGTEQDRASILISAARISDVLGNSADAASFVQHALAALDEAADSETIKALCAAAYRLKELKEKKWTSAALARALARVREGLDPAAETYAIPLIAKSGLDTIPGFDPSHVDLARGLELARYSQDAGVFRLFAEIYAASGDVESATQAADACYRTALDVFGRSQSRFTDVVSDSVIHAFRAARHRSGLLKLLDMASEFRSPGSEWERDSMVDMISRAAVELGFTDVLDRTLVLAQRTKHVWERASALSRVGKACAIARDKSRALSIARTVEDTVASGLRGQFPARRVRGALLLAAAMAVPPVPIDNPVTDDTVDPRYLAVACALTGQSPSLKAAVDTLSKYDIATLPLYTLIKKAIAENDAEALAAIERWEKETSNAMAKWDIANLRTLAVGKDSNELLQAARAIVGSFERLDVVPEGARAVVDALVSAGISDEAASIVSGLAESASRPRADAHAQVAWEAASFLASRSLDDRAHFEAHLLSLLDHAREVGMLCTARAVADAASSITALFASQGTKSMLTVVDEVANLQ